MRVSVPRPTCFVVEAGTMAVISVPCWELFLFLGLDENIIAELGTCAKYAIAKVPGLNRVC